MRSLTYLALAACLGGGYLLVNAAENKPVEPAEPRPARTAKLPTIVTAPPALPDEDIADEELPPEEEVVDDSIEQDDQTLFGMEEITDPAELAMLFEVDGTTYLRLSTEERATARGAATMTSDGTVHAVVAPVSVNALPATFKSWANRTVLVDGTCRARVTGFAEVSRVQGDASNPYNYDEDGKEVPVEEWTEQRIVDANVTLAAKLDGCTGTWARAADIKAPIMGSFVDEPELEERAIADLIALNDDLTQKSWAEMGGEGSWQDHADITAQSWQHPGTNEKWIFVKAYREGHCGDAGVNLMTAYRVDAAGKMHRSNDLSIGYADIKQIVDLDGDGQPELLGDNAVYDLASHTHDSIYVDSYYYGCGC